MNRFQLNYRLIILFLIEIVILNIGYSSKTLAQRNYLLENNDIGDYDVTTRQAHWLVGENDRVIPSITQKWFINNEQKEEFYVQYCEFSNIIDALKGTAFAAIKGNQGPYVWGSFNNSILADGSWRSLSGKGIYLVRGNVGVKIFKPINFKKNDITFLGMVASKVSNKLDSIFTKEEISDINYQVEEGKFTLETESLISLMESKGLKLNKLVNSKWIIDSTNISIGIRKEWTNNNGLTVGIDICKFNTVQDAQEGSKNMSKNTYLFDRIINMDELNSLQSIFDEWEEKWNFGNLNKSFSVVGYKGTNAVHIYNINSNKVDTKLIKEIFELMEEIF